jgi:hypothetical protein
MDITPHIFEYPRYPGGRIKEPYCEWHLKVSFLVGEPMLWDLNWEPVDAEAAGVPHALAVRFRVWAGKFQEPKDFEQHQATQPSLLDEGLSLCAELAKALKGKCREIVYDMPNIPLQRFPVEQPAVSPPRSPAPISPLAVHGGAGAKAIS